METENGLFGHASEVMWPNFLRLIKLCNNDDHNNEKK